MVGSLRLGSWWALLATALHLGLALATLSPGQAHESHATDGKVMLDTAYGREEQSYGVPDVTLRDQTGVTVRLLDLLDSRHSTLLQFIYTSCSTICPIMGGTFTAAQPLLDDVDGDHQLVSITIDPENDVPEVLDAYAHSLDAGQRWHFLTGRPADIDRVLVAFDAGYPGNSRSYHRPLTYLRAAGAKTWLRLDGLMSVEDLMGEYRQLRRVGLAH